MKKKMFVCVFLCLVVIGAGCASKPVWKSEPNTRQVENQYFYAAISPIFIFDGYKGFLLTIHSKTSSNIEVVWNKCFYLHNGKKNGNFILEGIPIRERKKPKPNDIITEGHMYQKEIFPSNLTEFSSLAKAWVYNPMKAGENGIHLTVKVGQKEMTEKLTLDFSEQSGK
jgi:hypothetical protein